MCAGRWADTLSISGGTRAPAATYILCTGGHHSRGLLGGRVPSLGLRQAAFQGCMRVKGPGRAPGAEHDKAGETHRAQGVKASRPLLHPLGTKTTSVSGNPVKQSVWDRPRPPGIPSGHSPAIRAGGRPSRQNTRAVLVRGHKRASP